MHCQIEFASSDSDLGVVCDKAAIVPCADCGTLICSNCRTECCGDSYCEFCYDYHVAHSCVRKPAQTERQLPGGFWMGRAS